MSPQQRFVAAIALMMAVLVGGNLLFPPPPPPPLPPPEAAPEAPPPVAAPTTADPVLPALDPPPPAPAEAVAESLVTVESPLYRFSFSTLGARMHSAQLLLFESLARDGPVQLARDEGSGLLGSRIVVEADTVELRDVAFRVTPASGLRLVAGGEPQSLDFEYDHPTQPFGFRISYTFDPDSYLVQVRGRAEGLSRGLLVTDLGSGLAFNEIDEGREEASRAYVVNQLQGGVRSTLLRRCRGPRRRGGSAPLGGDPEHLLRGRRTPVRGHRRRAVPGGGSSLVHPGRRAGVEMAVTQSLGAGGSFEHQLYAGPQEYNRLAALGEGFQEVNPVGWRFLRPVLRPIIGVIMWVLVFFHTSLAIGYGWVLILVGVLMRIVLFPLNHKAMRANLRNMAVQPLVKEIQTKYKDQPEKLQKEMVKLYKVHGFNPWPGVCRCSSPGRS